MLDENNFIQEEEINLEKLEFNEDKDNPLNLYLRSIAKFPVLSNNEQRHYIALAQAGDKAAFDKVICHNLRLIVWTIKHFAVKGTGTLTIEDLINEGYFGLRRAVEKFCLERHEKFSSYAVWWIRWAIYRSIRLSKLIPLPNNAYEKIIITYGDIENKTEENTDALALYTKLEKLIKLLPERQQQIIAYRFGFSGDCGDTLAEIGAEFGISHERVRKILLTILAQLSNQINFNARLEIVGDVLSTA